MNASVPKPSQQRNRAAQDILGGLLKYSSGVLREVARENFRTSPEGEKLAVEFALGGSKNVIADRVKRARALAETDHFYRLERFYQRYVAEEVMIRSVWQSEERRDELERLAALPRQGVGGTLELDPELPMPDYFDGVEYHLQPGGFDGFDLYGKGGGMAGAGAVFKYGGFAAVPFGANFIAHRTEVVREFPKAHYHRILEIGCSAALAMGPLAAAFPDAELVGMDLSAALLTNGHRMAETSGLKVHLKQKDARHTGEPDASFDAVLSYAVHHEAPFAANIEMFHEIFRVLKPGGDLLIADPPPFRAVEPFQAAILDWDTEHREEPYFSEASLSDWDEELRKIGFEKVESFALGQDSYPWVTRAAKPL